MALFESSSAPSETLAPGDSGSYHKELTLKLHAFVNLASQEVGHCGSRIVVDHRQDVLTAG